MNLSVRTVITGLCSLLTGLGNAEEPPSAADLWEMDIGQLLNVTITSASRFDESNLTAANSVSVINHSDWANRAARRTSDAFHHLPGLIVLPIPAGGNAVQVRGYGDGTVRGKSTLLDGVPINSFVYGTDVFSVDNIELSVLDRIELVRGPSSVLYGSDAFHSAIAYQSWRPEENLQQADLSAGQDDYFHGSLRSAHQMGNDWRLGVSLSASQEGDQGQSFEYQSPIDGNVQTDERRLAWESQTAIVQLHQEKSENESMHAAIYYANNDFDDFQGGGNASFQTYDRDRAGHDGRLKMARVGSKHRLPYDLKLQSKLYYWEMAHSQEYQAPVPGDTIVQLSAFEENRFGVSATLSQHATDIATRWSLEASYEEAEVDNNQLTQILKSSGTTTTLDPVDYSGTGQAIIGVSLDANTEWSPKWSGIWGGRYDDFDTFGSQFSPRLGMIFNPLDTTALKLVYSEAFRAPAAVELRGTSFAQGAPNLEAETLQNLELSLFHDAKKWEIEWTVFQSRWKDRILLVPTSSTGFTSTYENSGEYRSTGTELTYRSQLERWVFEAGTSYIYSENRNTGNWTSLFPKLIVNLGIGYSWPKEKIELFAGNRFHDKVYRGDQALPPFETKQAPIYFRTDLTLRKTFNQHWKSSLQLRNIFNRDNVLPSFANSYNGTPAIGFEAALSIDYQL